MVISLHSMEGLIVFKALKPRIKNILRNLRSLDDASYRTMYSEFLNPEVNKGHRTLTESQLLDEAQVLFVGQRLVDEVRGAWPVLDQPPPPMGPRETPFLASVFAVPSGLPRVVPRSGSGAIISGVRIPGRTVVSQSSPSCRFRKEIFAQPHDSFIPDGGFNRDPDLWRTG
ncbi:hypothetical protein BC826DRAFT_1069969, partial [Russula brevipes]